MLFKCLLSLNLPRINNCKSCVCWPLGIDRLQQVCAPEYESFPSTLCVLFLMGSCRLCTGKAERTRCSVVRAIHNVGKQFVSGKKTASYSADDDGMESCPHATDAGNDGEVLVFWGIH